VTKKAQREEEVGLKLLLGSAVVLMRDAEYFFENDDIGECVKNLDSGINVALTARNQIGLMSKTKSEEETDE
jgi:hypothetical protein